MYRRGAVGTRKAGGVKAEAVKVLLLLLLLLVVVVAVVVVVWERAITIA
jgi:hypothetical protein